jgi:hypothetical protein
MRDSIMRSWKSVLVGALPLVASLAFVSPASAVECASRDQIKEKLAHDFDEKPVAMGLSAAGAALVIFASPKGTWTTTVITPQGAACVVDVGEGWTDMSTPSEKSNTNTNYSV